MSKPLSRFNPATVEVETGIGCYDELIMRENAEGNYINRDELLDRLNQMLVDAADPCETDALNNVIKLLGA